MPKKSEEKQKSYLVDSDILINFLRGKEPGLSILQDISNYSISISVVSWMKIVYGIKKSNYSKRIHQFEDLVNRLSANIVSIGQEVSNLFVDLEIDLESSGSRLADFDLLITDMAINHDKILVTGNKKHFSRIKKLKMM